MRLIYADAFAVVTFKDKSEEFIKGAQCVLEMLDNQPTAYSVDAVVKQLESKKEQSYYDAIGKGRGNAKGIAYGQNLAYRDAIDIVRAGGKE